MTVDVDWNSTGAAPGDYDIILDGFLKFANEQYEETHSVVEDAFVLYDPYTMLFEVPEVKTWGEISGVTMVSDTCYEGDQFIFVVWVNNTGSTLFIPEIVVTFEGEDYESGPLNHIYCEDPCEPGLNPIVHMCQIPDEMEAGEYQCSVDMNMHYLDVEVLGSQETEETYLDCYTCEETDPDEDPLLHRWLFIDTEPVDPNLDAYLEEPDQGYYDFSKILCEVENLWYVADYTEGYCFRWFLDEQDMSPDEAIFCAEEVDPTYEYYQIDFLEDLALSGTIEVANPDKFELIPYDTPLGIELREWYWTWEPTFSDEDYHDILVEVRERTVDFSLEGAWIETPSVILGEPFPIYVHIQNTGGYPLELDYSLIIPELDAEPIVTCETEPIAPVGTSVCKLEVELYEEPDPDMDWYEFTLQADVASVVTIETMFKGIPPPDTYIHLYDDFEDHDTVEWFDLQDAYYDVWRWEVSDTDWHGVGTHTIVVEVTDDIGTPEYTGDPERTGIAILEVIVTEDDQGGTTEEPSTTDSTGTTEPEVETPPEEEMGELEESQGFSIQSIIEMILSFFQNLFG